MDSIIALIPVYQSILSRCCGGWLKLPGENFLYAIPYMFPIWELTHNPYLSVLAVISTGILKGQANREYMDLGTWTGPDRPHRYSILFNWLHLPPYWHDFVGLSLVGLAPALIPSLIAGYFDPIHGVILALGGASKGLAYAIGHLLPKYQTETGELGAGLFAGCSIWWILSF